MIDNGAEVAEDWTWLQTSGYAMRFQQVPAKAAVAISNSFGALASEEPESQDSDGIRDHVPCVTAPKPVASVHQRTRRPAKLLGASRRCGGPMASHCVHAACSNKTSLRTVPGHQNCSKKTAAAEAPLAPMTVQPKLGAFVEKRIQFLRPLAAGCQWSQKLNSLLDESPQLGLDCHRRKRGLGCCSLLAAILMPRHCA